MASDLVRVRENGVEHNEGRSRAIAKNLQILDEPTHKGTRPRPATRVGGRPIKPRTTVAKQAAAKQEKTSPPPPPVVEEPQAAVIEPAPNDEEQNR